MAFAAEPLAANASSSPVFGENSIFCHEMVSNGSRNVGIRNVKDNFPESYTLKDLTESLPESLEHVERAARDWIDSIPRQRHLEVLLPSSVLPKLSEFQPFHSTSVIKPDVTVVTCGTSLPILTVEVLSETYELTVKKALINVIEQYRILRAHNPLVESCVGFVFPRNVEESCVTKVEVKFVNFHLTYTLEPLCRQNVSREVGEILRQDWSHYMQDPAPPYYPYFIRLSARECDRFKSNAEQVFSKTSLLIRNHNRTKYWKYNPRITPKFLRLSAKQIAQPTKSLLKHSLLPSSELSCGEELTFYEFEGLDPQKSRESAKRSLVPLIEQVKVALEELHSQSVAHMDVCLPNICFTRSSDPSVKLIDLDRCKAAYGYVRAQCAYKQSDMYTPPEGRLDWQNYRLD